MPEHFNSLSVERFISANIPGAVGPDSDFIHSIVEKSLDIGNRGELKITNFSILTPFVALGGDVDSFVSYFKSKHNIDPQRWDDWDEILKELQDVFDRYFS